jgi:Zn-dependent protease with chaperone function
VTDVSVALLLYALGVCVLAPLLMRRGGWSERAPRTALVLWLATCLSVVAALTLGAVALVLSAGQTSTAVGSLLGVCATALRGHYSVPWIPDAPVVGALAAGVILAWVGGQVAVAFRRAARTRRDHTFSLALTARSGGPGGSVILTHDTPAVYCVPGRRPTVVLTTGALGALAPDQLEAALAHEQAHIRQRHHLFLAVANGLRRAFPFVPLFREAFTETTALVELAADDAAVRHHGHRVLAEAVVAVAAPAPAPGGLGVGGSTALRRVRRLVSADAPLGRAQRALAAVALLAMIAVPVLLVGAPLGHLGDHCPPAAGAPVTSQA